MACAARVLAVLPPVSIVLGASSVFGEFGAAGSGGALGLATEVECYGGADEGLEGWFVELVVGVEVDGSAEVAVEAGVEEAGGVGQGGPVGEGEFDDVFVGLPGAYDAVVGPDGRSAPLPLFDDLRVGLVDDGANMCEGLAAPVCELMDLRVDEGGGGGWWDGVAHGCGSLADTLDVLGEGCNLRE